MNPLLRRARISFSCLIIVLCHFSCDDSNPPSSTVFNTQVDIEDMKPTIDQPITDTELNTDMKVDNTPRSCGETVSAQLDTLNGSIAIQSNLGGAGIYATLTWPNDSLNLIKLVSGEVITQEPNLTEWPSIEFDCTEVNFLPDSRRALTSRVNIRPVLQGNDYFWHWQQPAQLKIKVYDIHFESHLPLDKVELWWWPYQPNQTELSTREPKRLMLRNPQWNSEDQELAMHIDEWGSYALLIRDDQSDASVRPPTYRALIGVSMGGGGSAHIGARSPHLFDFVAALGGPSDWLYMLHYVTDRLLGGFCSGDALGEFCGTGSNTHPFEQYSDFLNFIYTENGATFDRDFYIKVFQDVVLAFGNPTMYHPDSPYLPPGIPIDELFKSKNDRCKAECRGEGCEAPSEWLKLDNFFDDEFNPDGTYDVIPICDGEAGDGPPAIWAEAYHNKPVDLFLAVDLNSNGRRDQNEPIIINTSEPYADIGCDGLPDLEEPGYHPLFNPDPNGDNFHWLYNPFGTENDQMFQGINGDVGFHLSEELPAAIQNPERNPISVIKNVLEKFSCGDDQPGEPFDDYGLDGVPLTLGIEEGGFDWGEGNGRFDYNPHKVNFMTTNPAFWLVEAFTAAAQSSPRFWIDGGLRDVMNFVVASMHLAGRLHAISPDPVTLYDDFEPLLGADLYLPGRAPVEPLNLVGKHVLFRYGDPKASEQEIEAGDGAHVGSDAQAAGRVNGAMQWIASTWKEQLGEQSPAGVGASVVISDYVESEDFGGRYRFEVVTPPGYNDEVNRTRRYPVVYFLHGYGQKPRYLTSTNIIFNGIMSTGIWPPMIFVYPDGSCSDMIDRACNDSVDNDGDGLVDLDDPGCQGNENRRIEDDNPTESSPPRCRDHVDNDRDGLTDLDDPGCLHADHDDEGECREGTFYLDHLVNVDGSSPGRNYEAGFLDMIHYIDRKYRTLLSDE